jgi:hypothetical protein
MVDRDFGNWLAGFIDGEGCFYITRDNARGVYRARFSLTLRADDRAILEECHSRVGIGTLHNYKAQSGNMVTRWIVQSYADVDELVEVLHRFPLRAKKRKDFEIWSRAAAAVRGNVALGRSANNTDLNITMSTLKSELAIMRTEGVYESNRL